MPPYLAGRQTEQALFRDLLGDLSEGAPPAAEVVLYGPRGNGKTVLLRWAEEESASWPRVEAVRLAAAGLDDARRLAERLLPESWWGRLTPREATVVGFTWRAGEDDPPPLDRILAARARKNPLVVLLDEAHTLDLEVGRMLLNASQLVGRELPFFLVLAGTPNLETHLNRMGASFWGRAERLPLGRLDEDATRQAFERPFRDEGVAVSEDALTEMADLSQGYPYFVQLLGRAVWQSVSGDARVAGSAVEAAVARFERGKGAYYADRHEELERRELLAVARAVAAGFRERTTLGFSALNAQIVKGLPGGVGHERIVAARDTLRDLGFIWRTGPRPEWEPGIPSLMDYILEFVPP